jgi:hypothetical protein
MRAARVRWLVQRRDNMPAAPATVAACLGWMAPWTRPAKEIGQRGIGLRKAVPHGRRLKPVETLDAWLGAPARAEGTDTGRTTKNQNNQNRPHDIRRFQRKINRIHWTAGERIIKHCASMMARLAWRQRSAFMGAAAQRRCADRNGGTTGIGPGVAARHVEGRDTSAASSGSRWSASPGSPGLKHADHRRSRQQARRRGAGPLIAAEAIVHQGE